MKAEQKCLNPLKLQKSRGKTMGNPSHQQNASYEYTVVYFEYSLIGLCFMPTYKMLWWFDIVKMKNEAIVWNVCVAFADTSKCDYY